MFSFFTNWFFSLCIFSVFLFFLVFLIPCYFTLLIAPHGCFLFLFLSQEYTGSRIHIYMCICVFGDGWIDWLIDRCMSGAHIKSISCGGENIWGPWELSVTSRYGPLSRAAFLRKSCVCGRYGDWHSSRTLPSSQSLPVLFLKLLLL